MLTWQPEQADAQLRGQAQAAWMAVTAVAVQEQPERAAGSDPVAQSAQKAVVIDQSLSGQDHDHAPARAQVDGAKKRTPGVLATDAHLGLFSAHRPCGPQGRQVPQRRLV